jgi:hypothetical protein
MKMTIKALTSMALFFIGMPFIAYEWMDSKKPGTLPEAECIESVPQQDQDQEPVADPLGNVPFMHLKLDAAKNIVYGLAMEDFDLIAKSARDLNLLSLESQWEVYQTDIYIRLSNEFRDSTTRLRDSAHDKNLDGSTLAYFEVTLNCVRCHKYIRTNPK